jgi:hypothetical protein
MMKRVDVFLKSFCLSVILDEQRVMEHFVLIMFILLLLHFLPVVVEYCSGQVDYLTLKVIELNYIIKTSNQTSQ